MQLSVSNARLLDRSRAVCAFAFAAAALAGPIFGVSGASGRGDGGHGFDHGGAASGRPFQAGQMLGQAGTGMAEGHSGGYAGSDGGAPHALPNRASGYTPPAPPVQSQAPQPQPVQSPAAQPQPQPAAPQVTQTAAPARPVTASFASPQGNRGQGDRGRGGPPPRAGGRTVSDPATSPAQTAPSPPANPSTPTSTPTSTPAPTGSTSGVHASAQSAATSAAAATTTQDQPHHDFSSGGSSQQQLVVSGAALATPATPAASASTIAITPPSSSTPTPAPTPSTGSAPGRPTVINLPTPLASRGSVPSFSSTPTLLGPGAGSITTRPAGPGGALGGPARGIGGLGGLRTAFGATGLGAGGLAAATAGVGLTGPAGTTTTGTGTHAGSSAHRSTSAPSSPSSGPIPTIPIIHDIEKVVPGLVWLALAAALALALVGTGAAVAFRRKANRQAGDFAAVAAAALTDPLTGVLNRRGFSEAVERELARARRYNRPFVLAYVDVRGLKNVNDTEGHLAGDALLKSVAGLLSDSARAVDVVGRLGGDEMGLLLAEQSAEAAAVVTDRIESQVAERRAALGLSVPWSLTVGTAAFPEDGETFDDLIGTADRRLYEKRGIELR